MRSMIFFAVGLLIGEWLAFWIDDKLDRLDYLSHRAALKGLSRVSEYTIGLEVSGDVSVDR